MKPIFEWPPAYLVSLFTVASALVFFTINILKYNWRNGELKTRIALQVWGWFKLFHILATVHGATHGVYLAVSLAAILYIVTSHFMKSPSNHVHE